jgi:hypothetical protein
MGATLVLGETGKLKYFDVPCPRNSRPTMMRETLSTRGGTTLRESCRSQASQFLP